MLVSSLALLVSLAAAGSEQVIDAFQYADLEAARRAWVASDNTPPVETVKHGNRLLLQFNAPFGTDQKLDRTIIDREVELDLAVPGQFTLEIAAEKPEAVGRLSLYFRSGDGWYSGGAGLPSAIPS